MRRVVGVERQSKERYVFVERRAKCIGQFRSSEDRKATGKKACTDRRHTEEDCLEIAADASVACCERLLPSFTVGREAQVFPGTLEQSPKQL